VRWRPGSPASSAAKSSWIAPSGRSPWSPRPSENVLNTPARGRFQWRELVSPKPLTASDRRAFIEFKPILDFNALEPGKAATDAIREAAGELNLAGEYNARVRLTGPVPIANEEFATVQDGAIVNGIGTVLVCAGHSLDGAAFAENHPGRVCEPLYRAFDHDRGWVDDGGFAEPALDRVCGAFVGLGVDFGIQYSVRYRSERFKTSDLQAAC